MTFSQSKGVIGDGIVLGTFNFKPKTVTASARTSILLANGAVDSNSKTLSNTIVVVDGSAQSESAVDLTGDPFVVSLEPVKPALLKITCTTQPLSNGVFPASVSWTSPAGGVFSQFQVYLDDKLLQTLDAMATETDPFYINTGGSHPVRVVGLALDESVLATATCTLTTIFKPEVECSQVTVNDKVKNEIEWSIPGQDDPVDHFRITKNGALYKTVDGTVFSDEDSNPSVTGSDSYQVAGVIDQTGGTSIVGPAGSCTIDDPNPDTTDPPKSLSIAQVARQTGGPISIRLGWANGEAYSKVHVRIFIDGGANAYEEDLPGTSTAFIWTAIRQRAACRRRSTASASWASPPTSPVRK